jgi:hypothetical protein
MLANVFYSTLAKTKAPTGHQTSARMPVGDRRRQELTLCVGFVRVRSYAQSAAR